MTVIVDELTIPAESPNSGFGSQDLESTTTVELPSCYGLRSIASSLLRRQGVGPNVEPLSDCSLCTFKTHLLSLAVVTGSRCGVELKLVQVPSGAAKGAFCLEPGHD